MSPTGISRAALAAGSCLLITLSAVALSGCVLTPSGTAAERERQAEAGAAWEPLATRSDVGEVAPEAHPRCAAMGRIRGVPSATPACTGYAPR